MSKDRDGDRLHYPTNLNTGDIYLRVAETQDLSR